VTRYHDALLDELRTQGDPPADAAVAAHFALVDESDEQLLVDLAVEGAPEPSRSSAALDEFIAADHPLPAWASGPDADERIARGQDLFAMYGLPMGSALYCASLPEGYAAPRIARTLVATASLTGNVRRRIAETSQFILDTMEHGGLARGRPGWTAVRRVRVMHAAIRHHVARLDPGGVAVNQEELLGTLLSFTWPPFRALEKYGLPLGGADRDAYLFTWSVIGALLGIREDLLPLRAEDLAPLDRSFRARYQGPSEDGVVLTDALVRVMQGYLPAWLGFLRPVPPATIRYLVGDDVADLVAVPPAGWARHLFEPARTASGSVRLDRLGRWAARRVAVTLGRRIMTSFVTAELRGHRAEFEVPAQLAHAWKLRRAATRAPVDPVLAARVDRSMRPGPGCTIPAAARVRATQG
jgi:ER-bound oxygenase mpaB/B'/Rubber oxygenase, catalytic domain